MAAQAISPPNTASQGTKRSAEDLDTTPTKRRRYHRFHAVRHKQTFQVDPAEHCQDEKLFQDQLDRALAIALCSVGFDSAKRDALESLRAATQEFILSFASKVRSSMLSSRRIRPLPQDFIAALAKTAPSSAALLPQTSVAIPPTFASLPVLGPLPDEGVPPTLDRILGESLDGGSEQIRRIYIPKHFPGLPSRHTWQATPVFPSRETDPRKIRERATEEGVLAEQALRKLAVARKRQAVHRSDHLAASQRRTEAQRKKIWEEALTAVLREDQNAQRKHEERQHAEDDGDAIDGLFEAKQEPVVEPEDVEMGMLVNYDRKNWRKGASGRTALA